jgi:GDPmannose 4,6-dehydratase
MPSPKVALVFGITGQDGSYLAELLLEKGYVVHGVRRRSSSFNTARIDHLINNQSIFESKLFLHYGDLADATSISEVITQIMPDEIYNLAAQSHVGLSFEMPVYTVDVVAMGSLKILECIRQCQKTKSIKYYQASTSELFGGKGVTTLNEDSQFIPQSPYAAGKLFAYWATKIYREAYGIYAVNGILFNHESFRRGETFVTRKITRGLSRIKSGLQEELILGNLYSIRDWGHAKDYVMAMWCMMQLDQPQDLVISTGEHYSVKEFVNLVADRLGFNLKWTGDGANEIGVDLDSGKTIVQTSVGYKRPLEVDFLAGDSSRARALLNWEPTIGIQGLVNEMVDFDLSLCKKESTFPAIHRA